MAKRSNSGYPRNEGSVRHYRLWDAEAKHQLRWRCYASKEHAHMGALYEARWAAVGRVLEVYDCHTGKMLGQYKRTVDSIAFLEA